MVVKSNAKVRQTAGNGVSNQQVREVKLQPLQKTQRSLTRTWTQVLAKPKMEFVINGEYDKAWRTFGEERRSIAILVAIIFLIEKWLINTS